MAYFLLQFHFVSDNGLNADLQLFLQNPSFVAVGAEQRGDVVVEVVIGSLGQFADLKRVGQFRAYFLQINLKLLVELLVF